MKFKIEGRSISVRGVEHEADERGVVELDNDLSVSEVEGVLSVGAVPFSPEEAEVNNDLETREGILAEALKKFGVKLDGRKSIKTLKKQLAELAAPADPAPVVAEEAAADETAPEGDGEGAAEEADAEEQA